MPRNKLASYEEVEFPIEETSQIPSYIKMNSDVNNPRFIADGMNEFERNIKRIGDFLLSGISLIIFSPLFVICYILVRREDGGPAIFKQERIGRFGRPFYIYKFRSMRVDAEKNGPQLFGHKKDTRMTKIGVFLRDRHLDELPQLWNILRGDMSIVGPRPCVPREVEQYDEYERQRLYVTPGLTCFWQIQPDRNSLSFDEWMELDIKYIQERSVWVDTKIIFKTVGRRVSQ